MPSRADHKPTGEVCTRCGLLSSQHRGARTDYRAKYRQAHPSPLARELIIGIDGEGQGRRPHRYNYLAAADENGRVWELGNDPKRKLATVDCLDFMLSLPVKSLVFGYAFRYDLTKILEDLPDSLLYLLFEEDRRAWIDRKTKAVHYRPVNWQGYTLNHMHRRFTVKHGGHSTVIWDVFAFFQSKFTKACIDWQIGNAETIGEMELMKERRSSFDKQSWVEIKAYCQTECLHLAKLGRELLDAHETAGYKLKSFFGAGSTASALMKKHDVREYIGEIPAEMREAVACAFFGGRFENSVIGTINRPVWNADINSAYPYAATFLPCLIHGRWRKLESRGLEKGIEDATLALIQWSLPRLSPSVGNYEDLSSWGPLPVRKANGTIAFPLGASSGWTWKEEFLAARRLRPDVHAVCAWLYTSDCACRPFGFLPDIYLERLRIGSDSRGIVLKLGPNSVYGKLVQSVGIDPPFQSWVWGSNITSRCRGQLLDAIFLSPKRRNVLMLATDGVWSDCPINLPAPLDTGTGHAKGKGPLGAWTTKEYPRGVFAARPGIYFPLNPSEAELSLVRGRGLGRRVLYEQHHIVQRAFETGMESVLVGISHSDVKTRTTFPAHQRFVGAKTGVRFTPKTGCVRSKSYGEWEDYPTDVSFDPRPKRMPGIGPNGELRCWEYFDAPSLPYENALKDPESALMELAEIIEGEQPDADFSEWEIRDNV